MKKIIVIGNGMVGYKFCEKLRKTGFLCQIRVFGDEPRPAYDRVHLSEYFSGKTAQDLELASTDWYVQNDIILHSSTLITEIDRQEKRIKTDKNEYFSYDILVLATGSGAFVPRIKGIEKTGVVAYRTIEDLEKITFLAKKSKKAVIMGGGLLGLEAAKASLDMGLETHVVEFASRLMPRQLDESGSNLLKKRLELLGLKIHLAKNTQEILGEDRISSLRFADGDCLETDMLIVSAGIVPRDELARKSGLEVGERGGVVVNDFLQTSDSAIYAIGEVALHRKMIYGLIAPGYEMAEVVLRQILGETDRKFLSFDMSTKLKLIGVEVGSFGDPFCENTPHQPIVFENKLAGIYKRINISADGKKLLGGILVGDTASYGVLLQMTLNRMKLPESPEDLILGERGKGAKNSAAVENLPDEALICSCESVTKGMIKQAIFENNLEEVSQIKSCTQAGTGCGGCVPMLKDILVATLKEMGKEVKKHICEHFQYSRQDLFNLIKVGEIRSYNELLDQYGQGDGCEICKPVLASLLASIWNDSVVKQDVIQDTNDRFLANIQRGGTYSVVPRIAGGEITPEKLIVMGKIAKKYGLYTKITGGQRIDMFGATLEELPLIWAELIEAGFESGHAYGKALRTIKSCVGSTWCRFGLHDSVSFAIRIENRYKGIRAPHKIKGAVSGCVRECAEAQSKDFGLIATEKGWNLFVGGNGGAKPQHAILLASDIDEETCIRYIDRYLMFYIKTADPLTRTATWINKLDGGIEYLKDVIIGDSLGIAEQLETEIQALIDNYHCEWREVVENKALKSKFSHFVNSNSSDDTLEFVDLRGQKIPAPK